LFRHVFVLSGAGVGGGSLVYANVLYDPLDAFFADPAWSDITDWRDELAPYYDQAKRMLGSTRVPFTTPSDEVMRRVAERMGVADTFHPTNVAVFFGPPGEKSDDPFFGGAGPRRSGCTSCGGCMVGCRHDAKNTLDHNYLYLAERNGAEVHPETQVVAVRPRPEGGYEVETQRTGAWMRRRTRTFTAGEVVLSAGVLGTLKLLFSMREDGTLGNLSPRLGELVRTNSEAIVSATAPKVVEDYSSGIAITSSMFPAPDTNIEPVRYPKGSNFLGFLSTPAVEMGRLPRRIQWILGLVRHPISWLRGLSLYRWSERTILLLVMQSRDNSLTMRLKKGLFGSRLATAQGHGEPNPSFIPIANETARHVAEIIGGRPYATYTEVLLDVPLTAHILGGATIASSPSSGVIDPYQRVFGHPGLHVVDASAIAANLGANPSLTITALAERAMSMWPNKGAADTRPPLGEPYARVEPVAPRSPAVPESAPAALRLPIANAGA
jgi:cholesterol oxidase